MWAGFRRLFAGQVIQAGDVRSSKSDYTYWEAVPASYVGKPVRENHETDYIYYRPNAEVSDRRAQTSQPEDASGGSLH